MSIAALIQAAEYIERRDREAEHGYASSLPAYEESRSGGRRPKTKKSQGSRTTHNELEKNSTATAGRALAAVTSRRLMLLGVSAATCRALFTRCVCLGRAPASAEPPAR
uniref:BHLH domain-containing protein n=1 Tax=Heliothis virescens TaxID=7102 RepID=A0A2A4K870_HELVI